MKRFGLAPPLGSVNAATRTVAQLLTALDEWNTSGEARDPVAYLEAGDGDLYVTCALSARDAAELTRLIQAHSAARRARRAPLFRQERFAGREDPARPDGAGIPGTPGGVAAGLVLIPGGDPPQPATAPPPGISPPQGGLIRRAATICTARVLDLLTRPARAERCAAPKIPAGGA